jgi:ribulose-phosphate 3-epimerase
MKNHIEIHPSILSADFACLERELKAVQDAGADRIHCDVMDGHFVPNITFGPFVVEAVKKCVSIPLDVHLMITEPIKYVEAFCSAGADIVTVHAEACDDLPAVCAAIRKRGALAGVSVNPDKPVSLFLDHLDKIDQVLIMSVFAGFSGQKFIPEAIDKIAAVRRAAATMARPPAIQVDGGINDKTVFECAKSGATLFVAGSFVFGNADYAARIKTIRDAARKGAAAMQ